MDESASARRSHPRSPGPGMSIAFQCPKCQKAYTVKDELARKQVVCKACQNRIRVPAPVASAAAPAPEVESLAAATLTDEPAPGVAEAPATFEAECPNCMETIQWDAKLAGKQAPCPNCRRIVRVPVPAGGRKDWRVADHRPTLAKHDIDPNLAGAWGNTTGARVVSRDALVEAEAIPDRKRQPWTAQQKVYYSVIVACLLGLVVVGALLFKTRRVEGRRDD